MSRIGKIYTESYSKSSAAISADSELTEIIREEIVAGMDEPDNMTKEYVVHGRTISETQKRTTELKYKLEHGSFVEKKKVILDDWFKIWMEEYKKNRVKIGTYNNYCKY